jgi:hypothetical protein
MQLIVNANLALDKEKRYVSVTEYGVNNIDKYTVVDGTYEVLNDVVVMNPKYDAEGMYVYGTTQDGEIVTVPYEELPIKDQFIVKQMHDH